MRRWQRFFGAHATLAPGWTEQGAGLGLDLSRWPAETLAQREACRAAGGTRQAERSLEPTQSGYYDIPHYRRALEQLCAGLDGEALVVELGCGGGRILRLLLDTCPARIAALDFNDRDLDALWARLGADERERVLPLCAALTAGPPVHGRADALLLVEATTGMAGRAQAFAAAARWLRPGGLMLLAEPTATSYFVHALLNHDWDNLRRLNDGVFDQPFGDGTLRMHFASPQAIAAAARDHAFEHVAATTVPAEHALLLHALKDAGRIEQQRELIDALDPAAGRIPRLDIYLFRYRPT